MPEDMLIAIDGPAASGKSTVAVALSRKIGCLLIDSGSMYRAVTLLAVETGTALDDEEKLVELAREVRDLFSLDLPQDSPPRVFLGEREVTDDIRSSTVGHAVSPVSAVEGVRKEMVELQRGIAISSTGAVVEGRDIGTTVFPDAFLKVYLDATEDERSRRRFEERRAKGSKVTPEQVRAEIRTRDRIDSSREASPLTIAPGALVIDTTYMTIDEVVEEIAGACSQRQ